MKTKKLKLLIVPVVVGVLGATSMSVFANEEINSEKSFSRINGNYRQMRGGRKMTSLTDEKKEEMKTKMDAFKEFSSQYDKDDLETLREAMKSGEDLTEEQQEIHDAIKAYREKNGLRFANKNKKEDKEKFSELSDEQKEEMKAKMDAFREFISQYDQEELKAIYEAIKNGEELTEEQLEIHDVVKSYKDESGVKIGMMRNHRRSKNNRNSELLNEQIAE